MIQKLTSRKFILCLAAFLGSIATSIGGIVTDTPWVVTVGTVCSVLSAAFYALAEAMVDRASVASNTTSTSITATSSSQKVVEKALLPAEVVDTKVGGTDA